MALDQMMSFDPKADFASRVARIQAGGLHTNRTLFVGNEEALVLPPGAFRKKQRKSRIVPMFVALVTFGAGALLAAIASINLF